MTDAAALFAAVFISLYVAHSVGDHWVQSSCQAAAKGLPGWTGRLACGRHIIGLTVTKALVLALVVVLLDLDVTALGLILGFTVDAASHYWADRRTTLAALARTCGKSEFYGLGTPSHPAHPVTAEGGYAPTLGTGAYALDQSWHHLWLLVAAVIIAAV
ncbi:transcriptional regulator [Streptomyces ipomoeae]|uniref:transcriptional regulator n=1 Tax=Streptomyces ipomoeae TaxID=103232 RepID=UPI0029B3C026|nr:transcriptional regulator [Streptomyces ipomoeae]MDX2695947.1 transcriptional regulator [Streptomyces ipomoeae]MDX2843371.1 transcriptional regulator [Streptomyces ipomoeae]